MRLKASSVVALAAADGQAFVLGPGPAPMLSHASVPVMNWGASESDAPSWGQA